MPGRSCAEGLWPTRLNYIGEQNKALLPTLFDGRIQAFEIYRLDTAYWQKLLAQ